MAETCAWTSGVLFLNSWDYAADLRHMYLQMVHTQVPFDASWPRPGGVRHCEWCVQDGRAMRRASPQVHPSVRCHTRGFIRWPCALTQGGKCAGISMSQASRS